MWEHSHCSLEARRRISTWISLVLTEKKLVESARLERRVGFSTWAEWTVDGRSVLFCPKIVWERLFFIDLDMSASIMADGGWRQPFSLCPRGETS
jgi:hypothetical protein